MRGDDDGKVMRVYGKNLVIREGFFALPALLLRSWRDALSLLFALVVGLSLHSYWPISVAPVRGISTVA
jgi:hypothetical protein